MPFGDHRSVPGGMGDRQGYDQAILLLDLAKKQGANQQEQAALQGLLTFLQQKAQSCEGAKLRRRYCFLSCDFARFASLRFRLLGLHSPIYAILRLRC
jgi:hypothetical protein